MKPHLEKMRKEHRQKRDEEVCELMGITPAEILSEEDMKQYYATVPRLFCIAFLSSFDNFSEPKMQWVIALSRKEAHKIVQKEAAKLERKIRGIQILEFTEYWDDKLRSAWWEHLENHELWP